MAFWHMQHAGLLNANYDGTCSNNEIPGRDIGMASSSPISGFHFTTLGMNFNWWGYGSNHVYNLGTIPVLVFGNIGPSNAIVGNAALSAHDAHYLDRKLDNGIPNTGAILADHGLDVGSDNQCINYNKYASGYIPHDAPLAYMPDDNRLTCRIIFTL